MTSEEFATRLLQEEKVAVVPGTAFGDCGEGFLRISYAYSLDRIKIAIGRIEKFVFRLRDEQKEKEYTLNGQHYIRYPIKLYISSYGGSVYDGLGLAGIIKSSKTPVHTYAVGKVMSMGFLLALSGHKRFAYPHTTYMCHSLSGWSVGKIADLQESVEEDIRLQTKIDNIILENSNITQEQLNDTHTRKFDWYLDATTALELNCVDEIIN